MLFFFFLPGRRASREPPPSFPKSLIELKFYATLYVCNCFPFAPQPFRFLAYATSLISPEKENSLWQHPIISKNTHCKLLIKFDFIHCSRYFRLYFHCHQLAGKSHRDRAGSGIENLPHLCILLFVVGNNDYFMIVPDNTEKGLIKWTLAAEEIHNLYDERWRSACADVYEYNKGDLCTRLSSD